MQMWEAVVQAAIALTRVGRLYEARKWLLYLDTVPRDPESEIYKRHRFNIAFARATVAHSCDTERIRKDLVEQALDRADSDAQRQYVAILEAQQLAREGKLRRGIACAVAGAATSRRDHPEIACRLILQTVSMRMELEQFYDINVGLSQLEALMPHIDNKPLQCDIGLAKAEYTLLDGDTAEAIDLGVTGLELARSCEFQMGEAGYMLVLAQAHLRQGKRRLAHRYARSAFQLYSVLGSPSKMASAMVVLAETSLSRGETKAAQFLALHAISTAEKLSLRRLHARALDVTLCVQAVSGDWADAKETLAKRRAMGGIAHESQLGAEIYYWRLRDRPKEASNAALELRTNNWHAIWGRLELCRCLVQNGSLHEIGERLRRQIELAEAQGYQELVSYGELIAGAVNPRSDAQRWKELRNECRFAPWIELFLGSIEFDTRRLQAQFETKKAIEQAHNLRLRSVDLAHSAQTTVANKLIEDLVPPETNIVFE
jgi:hypothetical protein